MLKRADRTINEQTSFTYRGTVTDGDGQPLAAADLDALTLTLYDVATGDIINGRDAQDILNANDVTVSAEGEIIWTAHPADMVIVGTPEAGDTEEHVALFRWRYNNDNDGGAHELHLFVKQLAKIEGSN